VAEEVIGRPVLQAREVRKDYGGLRAVADVSFDVAPGEVLGIAGPNGAGKTTLFDVITGHTRATAGEVLLGGKAITSEPVHVRTRLGLARTFQLVRPFPGLTALENVLVGVGYGCERLNGSAARRKAVELLLSVGLEGLSTRPAHTLPVTARKRLELARALATSPKLLLLDEFLAGLTPTEAAEAMKLIRSLQRQGLTLILVEHIVWALLDLSDRIVVLSAGEKIAEGAPATIAKDPRVIEVYLGESIAV